MISLRNFVALIFTFGGSTQAATTLYSISTSYSGPLAPAINTTSSQTRDLSDMTGLSFGESIQIQFIPDAPVTWSGSLFYPAGDLELTWSATVEITVGEHAHSFTESWNLTSEDASEGSPGGVFGSQMPGPPLMMRTLDVPWGTDLSNITITLRDLSTFSGGNFGSSSMSISGSLRTVSIPEPSTFALVGILPGLLLASRRIRIG